MVDSRTNHDNHEYLLYILHAQYVAKNADYGNSFSETFERFGLTAPVVRMWDKLQRIETLSRQDAKVKDESIRDTLLDLANYAIMTVMELDDKHKEAKRIKILERENRFLREALGEIANYDIDVDIYDGAVESAREMQNIARQTLEGVSEDDH